MKKTMILTALLAAFMLLSGCQAEEKSDPIVLSVNKLIDDLGETTLESEEAILAAEAAYGSLTEEQKSQVNDSQRLFNARIIFDQLRDEADYQALRQSLLGNWEDLDIEGVTALLLQEDGTARMGLKKYTWTLNRNRQTIRLEGEELIVFAVDGDGDMLFLRNPYFMTCIRTEDRRAFMEEYVVTVSVSEDNYREYIGDPRDVGPLLDKDGNETGVRLFALHSFAYDNGLIFYHSSPDTLLTFTTDWASSTDIAEPFYACVYTYEYQLQAFHLSEIHGNLYFIRADRVREYSYDPETYTRFITLDNGVILSIPCTLYSNYRGYSYNLYGYLVDPQYSF